MKKKLFILTLVVGALSTSCTKDWTCECNGEELTIENEQRSDAKETCENWGGLPGVECELKLL